MDEAQLRLMFFLGILLLMMLWEVATPKKTLRFSRTRWPANLGLVALNTLLLRIVFRGVLPAGAIGAAWWAKQHGFGLFNMLHMPEPAMLILSVLLLDLAIYAQHVLFHTLPILWRLHMVHHTDRDIDVTTALRFHPIEIMLSMLIKISLVVLLGIPPLAVLVFEITLNGMAMFNHSNIALPVRLDNLLRSLLVTPDMHRVHHSVIRHETNSNFGFNLSCWDHLFGTYRAQPLAGHADMQIGLAHLQNAPTHRLSWLLGLPFAGRLGQYPIIRKLREDSDE